MVVMVENTVVLMTLKACYDAIGMVMIVCLGCSCGDSSVFVV